MKWGSFPPSRRQGGLGWPGGQRGQREDPVSGPPALLSLSEVHPYVMCCI